MNKGKMKDVLMQRSRGLRNLCVLICVLALLFTMAVPSVSFAASDASLIINGTDLTTDDDHTVTCGDGTAVYDPDAKTLTLTNATITGSGSGTGIQLPEGEITVVLAGSNKIENFNYALQHGNDSAVATTDILTITGTGSLDISGCSEIIHNAQDFIIEKVTLTAKNTKGITMHHALTIKDGAKVSIEATTTGSAGCIYLNGTLTVEDSELSCASAGTFPIFLTGVNATPSLNLENSTFTLNSSASTAGVLVGYGRNSGAIKIEDTTIYDNTTIGIWAYTCTSTELSGDTKIITDSNRILIRTTSHAITDNLSDDASLMGLVLENEKDFKYLTDYTLKENLSISGQNTLTVAERATLTIEDKIKITTGDDVKVVDSGAIVTPCSNMTPQDTVDAVDVDEGNPVTLSHSYGTDWEKDSGGHWQICSVCGVKSDKEEHVWGETKYEWSNDHSACTATNACTICGYTVSETATIDNEQVTKETTRQPTATKYGELTYTAVFEASWAETQTVKLAIDPTGGGDEDNNSDNTAGTNIQKVIKSAEMSPDTGDDVNIVLCMSLMGIAFACGGVAIMYRRRTIKKDEEGI